MASIESEVKRICDLADEVIKNPGVSPKEAAIFLGLPYLLGGAGSLIALPLGPALLLAWAGKKLFDRKRHEEEKERMLREVIRKQQAVIKRLEEELAKERQQNANNRKEIENLKEILQMLEGAEKQLRAA